MWIKWCVHGNWRWHWNTHVFWLVIIHLLYLSLRYIVGYFGGIEGGASRVIWWSRKRSTKMRMRRVKLTRWCSNSTSNSNDSVIVSCKETLPWGQGYLGSRCLIVQPGGFLPCCFACQADIFPYETSSWLPSKSSSRGVCAHCKTSTFSWGYGGQSVTRGV